MPLVMEGQIAMLQQIPIGTDVNFGELTRSMFNYLTSLEGVTMHFNHEVRKDKREDKTWRLKLLIYLRGQRKRYILSSFSLVPVVVHYHY
jgi:malate dehydrogenase (quinone)